MPSPLFNQLSGQSPSNPMIKQLQDFRKTITGNPQDIIQNMLNSGKISQTQLNKYAQQANDIYKTFGPFLK